MHILCIETSTDVCSVGIATDGVLVALRETERTYSHTEVITLFIQEVLTEAGLLMSDLAAVAVSSGPGSYTALRIGSSTAKGICYALGIPLLSVDTIRALACGIKDRVGPQDLIIPLLDARRKEAYHAVYDAQLTELEAVAPIVLDDTSFLEVGSGVKIHFCGDAVPKAREILTLVNGVFHEVECSAEHMVTLAFEKFKSNQLEDIAYYTPYYFKQANITVQKKNILR